MGKGGIQETEGNLEEEEREVPPTRICKPQTLKGANSSYKDLIDMVHHPEKCIRIVLLGDARPPYSYDVTSLIPSNHHVHFAGGTRGTLPFDTDKQTQRENREKSTTKIFPRSFLGIRTGTSRPLSNIQQSLHTILRQMNPGSEWEGRGRVDHRGQRDE